MPNVRFLRLVPTLYTSPPLSIVPPIKVLVVVTNPKDERLLRSDVEIQILTQELSKMPQYQLECLMEPKLGALTAALERSPHIVHYVGHSGINGTAGNLILHDVYEGTHWLSAEQIALLLPSSVRLLCLSTCVTNTNYQTGGLVKFAHAPAGLNLPTTIVNQ